MATVHEEVPATTTFSNGRNQSVNNANILNASGNITYIELECNSQLTEAIVDALLNVSSDARLLGIPPVSTSTHTTLGSATLDPQTEGINVSLQDLNTTESLISVNDESRSLRSSEDETSVTTIPSYERLFLPTESLSRSPGGHKIYAEKMFPLNYGFPLWFPQPNRYLPLEYRRKGISVGDVGIITHNGSFDFLFNISLPAEHPINPNDLPDDFVYIPESKLRKAFQNSFNPSALSVVSNLDISVDLDENTNDIIFTCQDGDKGAILSLPDGASEEDLINEWDLKEFISKNALAWYKYARHCGIELGRRSLYLVTGHMKSKSWGIATFSKTVPERNSVLSISKSSPTNGFPFAWKKSGGATSVRTGPSPDPGLTSENGIQTDTENQCLFLRGFQISLSENIWNKMRSLQVTDVLAHESSQDVCHEPRNSIKEPNGKDRTRSGAKSSCSKDLGNDINVTPFPAKNILFRPLTFINDILFLMVPEAKISVIHDNLWSELNSQLNHGTDRLDLHEVIKSRCVIGYYEETGMCTLEPKRDVSDPRSKQSPQLFLASPSFSSNDKVNSASLSQALENPTDDNDLNTLYSAVLQAYNPLSPITTATTASELTSPSNDGEDGNASFWPPLQSLPQISISYLPTHPLQTQVSPIPSGQHPTGRRPLPPTPGLNPNLPIAPQRPPYLPTHPLQHQVLPTPSAQLRLPMHPTGRRPLPHMPGSNLNLPIAPQRPPIVNSLIQYIPQINNPPSLPSTLPHPSRSYPHSISIPKDLDLTPEDIRPESPAPVYEQDPRDGPHSVKTLAAEPNVPYLIQRNSTLELESQYTSDTYSERYPPSEVESLTSAWSSSTAPSDPIINKFSLTRNTSTWTSELSYTTDTPQRHLITLPLSPPPVVSIGRTRSIYRPMHDVTWLNHNWDSEPGPSRRPTVNIGPIAEFTNDYPEEEPEWEDAPEEVDIDDPTLYINFALLSNLAVLLRDKVPRGTLVKTSIPYPRAFTGKDIVSTIQSQIQRELLWEHGRSTGDRRAALQIARSLQSQLFFYEVEWDGRVLQDGVEDVYMFLDDEGSQIREELPSGLVTFMTRCYSPMCEEGVFCYSITCPRKGRDQLLSTLSGETEPRSRPEAWTPPAEVINTLPEAEIRRQTIIHKMISKEEQYIRDLDLIESVFIKPLQMANPPIMPPYTLEDFIEEVFGNVLDLRESNRRLLEVLYVRQREQGGVVQMVGDIFIDAAADSFREAYPAYIGHHPLAEKRLRDETEQNSEFRLFIERSTLKQTSRNDSPRLDLRHLLNRPTEHLQKYPVLLGAINSETDSKNPDKEYLKAAVETMKNLQNAAQLRTFQSAMGRGPTSKWEWHDLVPAAKRRGFTPQEEKRQATIFELIKGEMAYVNDLENIEHMYIQPLREAEPPIIPRDRLDQFLIDVFHNYQVLESHHRRLVEKFHEIQREHHPRIPSIAAAVFDAALNFREAYMEYVPNYPIAAYRIDDEMANNPMFRQFVERCVRHPDAHRLDMKNFINRPIPRLLRYELLLKNIMEESPSGHEDKIAIPQVIDVIKTLGKDTEPGVSSAKQKVELWRYNSNFVFKQGEAIDMDLRNEQRSLIHTGKLFKQPENGWNEWTELFILLFDNYLVPTKIKDKDGVSKYHVHRRPIPLDLITRVNFGDPPIQRTTGLIRTLRGNSAQSDTSSLMSPSSRTGDSAADARTVYPCTIHHNGRHGGPFILYAESQSARNEWKQKLEEALGLRKAVQEANKVFEIETLSIETFLVPHASTAPSSTAWTDGTLFTGKVTCSVPFNTPDGRGLVAIGCAEGVWIGFRHDSRSMRRVLHLRMVTQCAILQDFGLFIVLADKQLFAYHIEALVPTDPNHSQAPQTPQKLNGSKDAHFFSIGTLHGRTLVVYMKKRGSDSVFRALEPISDKIQERPRTSRAGGFFPRPSKKDWFREFREFVLPAESYDFVFLNAKVAVLCAKGFEIMDMTDFKSVTIPQREDSGSGYLARRCDACRPLGIFRCADDDYMLVYDEFGIFVNKRGDPSRKTGIIEWEGKAEHVALHPPHILLFDSRFIEIRHLDTGRLAQIIPGKDVRCVWDGRGADMGLAATPGEGFDDTLSQEPRVHAVMSVTEGMMGANGRPVPMRGVLQHVFELVPTIPLYLPGSLASPSAGGYFPQSYSPPRSPHLRPSASYRS